MTSTQGVDLPLVSVVTVCYNSAAHLAEAMESVAEQTYSRIEYVIVDGGSSDGTLDVIRGFEKRFDGRLTWVSEPDEGIYDAMNKGIALCTGDLIGLLNSDDAYLPDAIEAIVAAYADNPGAGAVYGDAVVMDESGADLYVEASKPLDPQAGRPDKMPMCHQSLFVAREVYQRLGTYDATFRVLADYEFILRCLREGVTFVRIDRPVARFRTGGACSSDMKVSNREREIIRVRYGASPLKERLRRYRHTVNNYVYGVVNRRQSETRER